MRSIMISGVILIATVFALNAQEQDLVFEYHINDPSVTTTGDNILVSFENSRQVGIAGAGSLPYIPLRVILPQGNVALAISFIGREPALISDNPNLKTRPNVWPISMAGRSNDVPFSNEPGIRKQVSPVNTGFLNGVGIAQAVYTPIVLDSLDSAVYYYKSIEITVKSIPDQRARDERKGFRPGHARSSGIEKWARNPEMVRYYRQYNTRSQGYDYLIITTDAFVDDFDTLKQFYKHRGFEVRIVSLDHINSVMSGADQQEKIRNYIKSEYQASGIRFVLLGGDVNLVPTRGFYCEVESPPGTQNPYTTNNMPADLYYAGLDENISWNADGDDHWAEPGEADLYPEIGMGRFPFSNANQLSKLLNKTILYQSQPVVSDLERPLLAGEHLWTTPLTWGADYMEVLVGTQNVNGYITAGIPPEHYTDTLYERAYTWDADSLMNRINSGVSALHHCGHANVNSVMHLSGSQITNSNFSQTDGIVHQFPLVYSHGCDCGDFSANDCIGEKMVLIDNFACAFIGNSRYGWFVEGTSEGPAAHLHREFVDAVYKDTLHWIGTALSESRIMTAPWVDLPTEYEPGAFRWNFYDINILGDPLMSLWTCQPHDIEAACNNTVPIGVDSVALCVTGNGTLLQNAQCAILQGDSIYGNACTNGLGEATIHLAGDLQEGPASLIVSGYNGYKIEQDICVADYWVGYSENWNDGNNWFTGDVPDQNTDVLIPIQPDGGHFPIENTSGSRMCNSLFLENGAFFTLHEGDTITITGNP